MAFVHVTQVWQKIRAKFRGECSCFSGKVARIVHGSGPSNHMPKVQRSTVVGVEFKVVADFKAPARQDISTLKPVSNSTSHVCLHQTL